MLIFFVLLAASDKCQGANILALLPVNSHSHFIVMEPLLLALRDRGHRLTVASSFPQDEPLHNLTDVDFSALTPPINSRLTTEILKKRASNLFSNALFSIDIHITLCEQLLKNERLQNLMNETFDLVIGELFAADCFNYVSFKMKAPLISWVTSTASPWMAERSGLPDNPSYIPHYFVEYGDDMTLFQRLFNTVSLFWLKFAHYYFSEVRSHRLAEKAFGEKLPTVEEVNRYTSLIFVNSHFSLSNSRPTPANVVEVGGIHIRVPRPLPEDIKEFLDSAPNGVILFSLGSLVRTSSLPLPVIRMFLDVFATLPERVIIKYEEDLSDVPSNVMFRGWLPQFDITAHSNVRMVITHGGLASTLEAVHFAKPLILIPLFADQFKNANNVVRKGAGVLLNMKNISQDQIKEALNRVLNDSSYAENMRRLSQQFRDRPMTPLQTAVYWTEYVIRHQGASHLRPASVSLPLYQYLLLDVIAVLTISVVIFLFAAYVSVRLIYFRLNIFVQKPTFCKNKKTN